MRTFGQKIVDFWDDQSMWNQYGISYVVGIMGFVVLLKSLPTL
jgi:hypothetical protein